MTDNLVIPQQQRVFQMHHHVPACNMLQDIIVGRGRSGGLALWVRGDADWLARSGVLQVYK
jgi:hypothetical protein